MFQAAPVGVATTDADGHFIDVNPRGCELLGRSLDELRQLSFHDVTHPDDLSDTEVRVQDLRNRGQGSYTTQKRYVRPDGTSVWCRTTVTWLTGEDGAPAMLGIIEDVSEERASQAALAELHRELERRERQYRTLVANIPGVIYRARATAPHTLLFVSDAVTDLLGYGPSDLVDTGAAAADVIHPDDLELLTATLDQRRAAVDEPFEYEFRVRHADGSVRWVYDTSRCVTDEDLGELVFDGVLFDITAQKQAEQAVRDREAQDREAVREREHVRQLQALARAAVEINSPLDISEMLRRITVAARDIIGAHMAVTSMTVPGTGEAEGWPQENICVELSDAYAEYRGYAAPSAGAATYGLVCANNDVVRMTQEELYAHPAFADFGSERGKHPPLPGWLAAPLVARDGSNLGMIQLSHRYDGEFTERDEAILVQLAQMASAAIEKSRLLEVSTLQAAQRFREELLAGISHDMQTPLAAIVGLAELLIDDPHVPAGERVESYRALHRQAAGLRSLVQQFLDYSRLQADSQLALRLRPTSVAAAIARTTGLYGHLRAITTDVPDDLPEVLADDHRLDQILANLLSNAIKFSAAPVEVAVEATADTVDVHVTDHGVGMDAEDLGRLFEKFHRGRSGSGVRGTGIGLYISHAVAEAQGGTLRARSDVGEGSTFTLSLPRADRPARG